MRAIMYDMVLNRLTDRLMWLSMGKFLSIVTLTVLIRLAEGIPQVATLTVARLE